MKRSTLIAIAAVVSMGAVGALVAVLSFPIPTLKAVGQAKARGADGAPPAPAGVAAATVARVLPRAYLQLTLSGTAADIVDEGRTLTTSIKVGSTGPSCDGTPVGVGSVYTSRVAIGEDDSSARANLQRTICVPVAGTIDVDELTDGAALFDDNLAPSVQQTEESRPEARLTAVRVRSAAGTFVALVGATGWAKCSSEDCEDLSGGASVAINAFSGGSEGYALMVPTAYRNTRLASVTARP